MLKANHLQPRRQPPPHRTASTILCILVYCCLRVAAQTGAGEMALSEKARQLADLHSWQEIVLLLGRQSPRSVDMNFYYGTALARLDRWPEAEDAFEAVLSPAAHHLRL